MCGVRCYIPLGSADREHGLQSVSVVQQSMTQVSGWTVAPIGHTWFVWVVVWSWVHHEFSEKFSSGVQLDSNIQPEQGASFAYMVLVVVFPSGPLMSSVFDCTGSAAMHLTDLPFLLRRPPFSQHEHDPHDNTSTPNPYSRGQMFSLLTMA